MTGKIIFFKHPYKHDGSYSPEELNRGDHWLNADVVCANCGKVQPVAVAGGPDGTCCACGKRVHIVEDK